MTRLEPRVRLAALALLLATVAVLAVGVVRGLGGRGPEADAAAALVPAGTLVYAHASTDTGRDAVGDAQALLTRFGAYEPQRDALLRRLSGADSRVDPRRDVGPWLGDEAALALVDTGQAAAGSLVLIAVRDRAAAQRFLDRNPRQPARRVYKGTPTAAYGTVVTAFVGKFLVIGQSLTVQMAIDNARDPRATLARSGLYRRTMATLPKQRAGDVFASAGGLRRLLVPQGNVVGALAVLLDKPGLRAVALSVEAREPGARLVAHSIVDPAQRRAAGAASPPFAPQLVDAAPADALAYLGVRGISGALGRLIGVAAGGANAGGVGPALARLRAQLQKASGGRLERDLLRLLDGEVALVVTRGIPAPTLTLVTRTDDEAATRNTLRRLQGPLARVFTPPGEAPPRFTRQVVDGVEAFTLRAGSSPGISYAVTGGRLLVATSLDGIRRARGAGPRLSASDAFTTVLGDRPDQVGALGFLDFSQLLELGEQTGLNESRAYLAVRDDLRKVRAVGVSSTGGEGESTAEILLSIP